MAARAILVRHILAKKRSFTCLSVCVFVRDNLENGWMDFDNFFLFQHYGPRLRHGHHGLLKTGWKLLKSGEMCLKKPKIALAAVLVDVESSSIAKITGKRIVY